MEIKLWNRNKGEVRFSSTSWLQLELQLTYLGIPQGIMKQSLIFRAAFKSVHRKAWETQYLYIHWFDANKLTRYWPKLYPSGALLQLSRELIPPFFSKVSCERFRSAQFLFSALGQNLEMRPSSNFFWQCLHFPQVPLNDLHHHLPCPQPACVLYLLLQVMGPRWL